MTSKRYNHTFSVNFSVESISENFGDTSRQQIIRAMQKQVDYLKAHPVMIKDSVEDVYDTYVLDESFPERDVEVIPPKFIVEGAAPCSDGLGLCKWPDVTNYLARDPHPAYRLVSVSIINHQSKLIWELK